MRTAKPQLPSHSVKTYIIEHCQKLADESHLPITAVWCTKDIAFSHYRAAIMCDNDFMAHENAAFVVTMLPWNYWN